MSGKPACLSRFVDRMGGVALRPYGTGSEHAVAALRIGAIDLVCVPDHSRKMPTMF